MKQTLNALITLRRNRSISQEQIGEIMGLSRGEISVVERGKRPLTFNKIGAYIIACTTQQKLSSDEKSNLIEAVITDFNETMELSTFQFNNLKISKENRNIIKLPNSQVIILNTEPKNLPKIYQQSILKLLQQITEADKSIINIIEQLFEDENAMDIIKLALSIPKSRRTMIIEILNSINKIK